ncbi:peptide POLARIS [Arabidopsis lyrata subsp. lyrata]|nr:peptide POLARIS [Arabidopsis lyrata subsp. lyrata]|eukprot:XP_020872268.1 peptide POLARIS [Arabidopsis lyrata subsp. lyrata]
MKPRLCFNFRRRSISPCYISISYLLAKMFKFIKIH